MHLDFDSTGAASPTQGAWQACLPRDIRSEMAIMPAKIADTMREQISCRDHFHRPNFLAARIPERLNLVLHRAKSQSRAAICAEFSSAANGRTEFIPFDSPTEFIPSKRPQIAPAKLRFATE